MARRVTKGKPTRKTSKAAAKKSAPRPVAAGSPYNGLGSGSLAVQRESFGHLAGLSFQDARTGLYSRSMNDALGYQERLRYPDFRARYERGGIAERIVEAYPKATWGGEIYFQESPDPNEYTPFEEAADSLFLRLGAWNRLERADILAGLGEYSVLLIGAPGSFESPLQSVSSPDAIRYLTPISQDNAKISEFDKDAQSERYGLPLFYSLTLSRGQEPSRVHWTRIVHIAEGQLENDIYGKPRLRAVWNRLDDLDKILGGGAEATWKRVDPGLQVDINPEIELSPEEEDLLDAELDEYHHGMRRHIRTRGGKISPLAANVAAFASNATSIMEQISGTVGIPKRILIGSERGELSSLQDRDNWTDRVTERRRSFATPTILSLANRFIDIGALPTPAEPATVVYPEIEELNSAQKATVAVALTNANQAQFNADGRIILEPDEIRARVFGLGPLNQEPFEMVDPATQAQIDSMLMDDSASEEEDAASDAKAAAALTITGAAADFNDVDAVPNEPDWKAVHRAADAHVGAFRRAFVKMWDDASELIGARAPALELAIARKNRVGATRIVTQAINEAEAANAENIHKQLDRALFAGGAATLRSAKSRGRFADPSIAPFLATAAEGGDVPGLELTTPTETLAITLSFNTVNPRALLYGRYRTASLLTETTAGTIEAVRILIARGIAEGIKPRVLRNLIQNEIGLRSDQLKALENFVAKGATEAQTKAYARKLLRDRALLIARTETMRAANEGQREVWLQAVEGGWLPADQMRVWVVTPDERLRDEHRAMSGQIRGLQEKFVKPGGERIEPGQEPNCRCSAALAGINEQRAYEKYVKQNFPDNPELAK